MAYRRVARKQSTEDTPTFFSRAPKCCPDVEACLTRIKTHNGVLGVIVVNREGIAVKSTIDNPTTQIYLEHCRHLLQLARHTVRDVDPTNELTFLRVRSKKNEILVAPDNGFTIIAIQTNQKEAVNHSSDART